jgi:formylglycine-generating enzyme
MTLLLTGSWLASCGGRIASDESDGVGGTRATGGTTSTGGTWPGSGGAPSTGGTTSTGGAWPGTGGTITRGGSSSQSGGSKATGGTSIAGGTRSTGGSRASGGAPTGGAQVTGGAIVTGGATSSSIGGTKQTAGTAGSLVNGGSAGVPTAGGNSVAGATPTAGTAGTPVSGGTAGVAGTATTTPPSCTRLGPICQSESCCTTIRIVGGTFPMGRSENASASDYYPTGSEPELPEHSATVGDFALDKYEVTVGRFRAFVNDYDAWHNSSPQNPQVGAGVNPNVDASNRDLTGWGRSWQPRASDLPTDSAGMMDDLRCISGQNSTWTDLADSYEAYPINCVSWFMAFAFCIWDDGWLPTEAEWEYAAAGGAQNLLYPWGNGAPDSNRANVRPAGSPYISVGSRLATGGAGYFGHADLAGSMYEWVFDGYSASYYGFTDSPVACNRCANTGGYSERVLRDACWDCDVSGLRAAFRRGNGPGNRGWGLGFRCARSVP